MTEVNDFCRSMETEVCNDLSTFNKLFADKTEVMAIHLNTRSVNQNFDECHVFYKILK